MDLSVLNVLVVHVHQFVIASIQSLCLSLFALLFLFFIGGLFLKLTSQLLGVRQLDVGHMAAAGGGKFLKINEAGKLKLKFRVKFLWRGEVA
jgi:hypothetical protein